ncbi:hypothetical protein KZ287_30365, partial [Escherichia coli]|nr:hypothetical protein [Escherichia coli]
DVTGCPSFFSRPQAFQTLRSNARKLGSLSNPRVAFSGTHHQNEFEQHLLVQTIKENGYFIEPHNRANYQFYSDILNNPSLAVAPTHFNN